jgi:hypothetical protein
MPDINDAFHRALYRVLTEKIDARMVLLAKGSASSHDDYRQQVGYLEALNDVLGYCEEIEKARYGEPEKEAVPE